MIANDWQFFTKEAHYWNAQADMYHQLNMLEDMDRCLSQANKCLLYRQQVAGEIYVVSGIKGQGVDRSYDLMPQGPL